MFLINKVFLTIHGLMYYEYSTLHFRSAILLCTEFWLIGTNRGSTTYATQELINLPNQHQGPRAFLLFSLHAVKQWAI